MPRALHPRPTPAMIALLIALLASAFQPLCPNHASAQPALTHESARPSLSKRVVRVFDFEEQTTNATDIPRHWIRAQHDPGVPRERPGFPIWNRASLDYTTAAQGQGSVRLPVSGGSTSLRLEHGVVPVFPGTDYLIVARVRTEALQLARARLRARFLDATGSVVEGSEAVSRPTLSPERWTTLRVELVGVHPGAAYAQLDLEVVQPQRYAEPRLEPHQLWLEDLQGAAWFDSIAIMQLPRVELATTSPANVVAGREPPVLEVTARDLTGEALSGTLVVYDLDANPVWSAQSPLDPGRPQFRLTPELDRFGWYRAVYELRADDRTVERVTADFVWIPDRDGQPNASQSTRSTSWRTAARRELALLVRTLPDPVAGALPHIVRAVGVGSVTLPLWTETSDEPGVAEAHRAVVRDVADRLLERWVELTLAFHTVPSGLADALRLGTNDPLALLAHESDAWKALTEPELDRYGDVVSRWQIGSLDDPYAVPLPRLEEQLAIADERLSALVPGPVLDVVWPLAVAPPELGTDGRAVTTPWPAEMHELAHTHRGPPSTTTAFALGTLDSTGARGSVFQFLRSAVRSWQPSAVAGPRLGLIEPWTLTDGRRPSVQPRPELAAMATLSHHLAGREIVQWLDDHDGITAALLMPADGTPDRHGGAMIVWRSDDQNPVAVLEAYLGAHAITAYDPFGNAAPVPIEGIHDAISQTERPVHRVRVGDTPVFLEGVDVPLVRTLASMHLEPGLLETTSTDHEVDLVLTNHGTPMAGQAYIVAPGGVDPDTLRRTREWTITPRAFQFRALSEETIRVPLTVAFRPYEEAGMHRLVLDLQLESDEAPGLVRVAVPFEIGLPGLAIDLVAVIRGDDLLVTFTVINRGDETVTLSASAHADGQPRKRSSVAGLPPGQDASRTFIYPGAALSLAGSSVFVSVQDTETGGRLTRSLVVPAQRAASTSIP